MAWAGGAEHQVGDVEHLVEGGRDDAAVHASRRPFVGGREEHLADRGGRLPATAERGSDRALRADHRIEGHDGRGIAGARLARRSTSAVATMRCQSICGVRHVARGAAERVRWSVGRHGEVDQPSHVLDEAFQHGIGALRRSRRSFVVHPGVLR
jgi:hypothetical protein